MSVKSQSLQSEIAYGDGVALLESENWPLSFGNRWMDSTIGKWISEDPIGFEAADSNLSRYVGNNSITNTDPTGLVTVSELWTSFWNPGNATDAWDSKTQAERLAPEAASELGAGGTSHNGPEDAIRHALWNAFMAQKMGADEAKKFGDAHESGSENADETAMDFWNNAAGRAIGAADPCKSEEDIKKLVMEDFQKGRLRVLRKTGSGPVPAGSPLTPSGNGKSPLPRLDPGVPYNSAPGNPYPPELIPNSGSGPLGQ